MTLDFSHLLIFPDFKSFCKVKINIKNNLRLRFEIRMYGSDVCVGLLQPREENILPVEESGAQRWLSMWANMVLIMHSHWNAANVKTSWVAPSDSQAFFFLSPMWQQTGLPFLVTQTNIQKRDAVRWAIKTQGRKIRHPVVNFLA